MSGQTYSSETSESWYAVHCRPLKEFYAESALRETLGIPTYLPTVASRAHGVDREVPFFPGYLFIYVDLGEVALTSINQTPGVLRMLTFGGEPLAVPKVVVSTIRERLEALNANGGLPTHNFHPGDTVRLESGPFRGLQAIFVGPMTSSARVKILLEFLGRVNEVWVGVEALSQARNQPALKSRRRTRGKGRPIRAS